MQIKEESYCMELQGYCIPTRYSVVVHCLSFWTRNGEIKVQICTQSSRSLPDLWPGTASLSLIYFSGLLWGLIFIYNLFYKICILPISHLGTMYTELHGKKWQVKSVTIVIHGISCNQKRALGCFLKRISRI